jgi:hypothetical protein
LQGIGVLRLDPEPKFATEGMRDFVASTTTEAEVQTWQVGGQGSWETVRSVAQGAAILIGVGLYFTQAEALSQWSGALTAATGLRRSLVTAMGAFRREKGKVAGLTPWVPKTSCRHRSGAAAVRWPALRPAHRTTGGPCRGVEWPGSLRRSAVAFSPSRGSLNRADRNPSHARQLGG